MMIARSFSSLTILALTFVATFSSQTPKSSKGCTNIVTGKGAFADYREQKPGVCRKITVADLPEPNPSESVDNGPDVIARPSNAWPQALPGFKVELFARGLKNPRL